MASASLTSYLSVPFCERIFIVFSEILFYFKSPLQSTSLFSLPTGHFFENKRLSRRKRPFTSFSKYCSYCIRSHIPLTARKHSLFNKHHWCTFLKLHGSLKKIKIIHVPTLTPSTITPKNENEGFKPSEFYFWFTYSTFNNTVKLGNSISYFVFWNWQREERDCHATQGLCSPYDHSESHLHSSVNKSGKNKILQV